MSIEDFQEEYDSVTICRVNDSFQHSNFKCSKSSNGNGLKFTIKKKGHFSMSIV